MRRILFTIFFIMLACPTWAEVLVTESTEYYPVDGLGKRAIVRNMTHHSPILIKGKRFHGNTKSKTRYKFSWAQKGDKCTLKKVTVQLQITYMYPKLTMKQSQDTMRWWEKHLSKLKEHELVHGRISKDGANELDRELTSLKELNCSTAKEKIRSVASQILRKTQKRQVQYDVLTEHGKKQERYKGQI